MNNFLNIQISPHTHSLSFTHLGPYQRFYFARPQEDASYSSRIFPGLSNVQDTWPAIQDTPGVTQVSFISIYITPGFGHPVPQQLASDCWRVIAQRRKLSLLRASMYYVRIMPLNFQQKDRLLTWLIRGLLVCYAIIVGVFVYLMRYT